MLQHRIIQYGYRSPSVLETCRIAGCIIDGRHTKARLNASVRITSQQPLPERALTQEQRLAWTKELLSGEPDTLAYRVAGILLLSLRPTPDQDRSIADDRGRFRRWRYADSAWARTDSAIATVRRDDASTPRHST